VQTSSESSTVARLAQRFGLTRYDADEYYKEAINAYNNRKLDEAILAMEQAIDLLPNYAEYYAARGFFYLEDGVDNKASADFEEALKRYPYEALAHYGRGVIAYKSKNWDEALAHFNDAYRADPDRAETLYYLAVTLHRQAENQKALPYIQRAAEMLETAKDRRRADAVKWLRQIERLVQHNQLAPGQDRR
jgi:tetratricopeptide (TPR) repeat protein